MIYNQNFWHFLNIHHFKSLTSVSFWKITHYDKNTQVWFFGPNFTKKLFPVQNRTNDQYHWIQYIWKIIGTKLRLNHTILAFQPKFAQKDNLQSKREYLDITIGFSIFKSAKMPNFILNRQFWFFAPSLPWSIFLVKNKKWTLPSNSAYLNWPRHQVSP